ncbi:unnamed protein product [Brassicogethes aeneus]|uniref:LysM domain-containing protein n=1 Tax=Brassicogethes aeneus TaxID=1431903 RepID=A0A9P0FCP7_BRAAE|nr:unnamed protein product [Brassicogethes aeneus]
MLKGFNIFQKEKEMDRGSYEKLSIRDSARSLKKYGSTSSKHVTRNENYIKHFVTQYDTLQGIALKYNVTIEQIRRANRLWASDSLFLKEFLLIPVQDSNGSNSETVSSPVEVRSSQVTSPSSTTCGSFDNDDISDFLSKIDASIANTKEDVKKTQTNSEFGLNMGFESERRKPIVSRMKQSVNNNSSNSELYGSAQAVVIQQGKKVRTSLKHHEKQQDELFEL